MVPYVICVPEKLMGDSIDCWTAAGAGRAIDSIVASKRAFARPRVSSKIFWSSSAFFSSIAASGVIFIEASSLIVPSSERRAVNISFNASALASTGPYITDFFVT